MPAARVLVTLCAVLLLAGCAAPLGAEPAGRPAPKPKWKETALEARAALAGIVTGEQVHYQREHSFLAMSDTGSFRRELGVSLFDLFERWDFSVTDVSTIGFLATARGRPGTVAERILVTARHEQFKPIVVRMKRERPRRAWVKPDVVEDDE